MQISQASMSELQPNFDQCYKERYIGQFVSEMFHFLQEDSSRCAPQYELNSFVSMTTYRVPDLSSIRGCLWPPLTFNFDICHW